MSSKPTLQPPQLKDAAPTQLHNSKDVISRIDGGIRLRVFHPLKEDIKDCLYKDAAPVKAHHWSSTPGRSDAEKLDTASEAEDSRGHDKTCQYRYLSLISDMDPGAPYECHPSKGEGVWIVIMDGGFTTRKFAQEFDTTERIIRIDRPAPTALYGPLWDRKAEYVCFDDNDDYSHSGDGTIRGHGTPIALIAGGSNIGVAQRANLLLYKVGITWCKNVGTEDNPERSDNVADRKSGYRYQAIIHCLQDLIREIDAGNLPKGKVVLSSSLAFTECKSWSEVSKQTYYEFKRDVAPLFQDLGERGVTIVVSAGNRDSDDADSEVDSDDVVSDEDSDDGDINDTTEDAVPTCFANDNPSITIVGGVDGDGHLWWDSLPGTEDCPVHVYAQGYDVDVHELNKPDEIVQRYGTSFATPQVAAIAACVLGDPKNADRLAYGDNGLKDGKTVGTRVREMIQELGFPRVSPEQTKRLSREYSDKGVDPSVVNVAYNGYKEDQLAPHTL